MLKPGIPDSCDRGNFRVEGGIQSLAARRPATFPRPETDWDCSRAGVILSQTSMLQSAAFNDLPIILMSRV
jgi:hypothetical protein